MAEPGLATDVASATAAWRQGVEAAQKGAFRPALLWLERAVRLAPGDPRIALDLANIRLHAGDPRQVARAAASLKILTSRYDVAAGWLGLMAARRLQGEHAAAAEALRAFLSHHCVPEDAGFAVVASAAASAAGWPGWCGIDAEGLLHIAASGAVAGFVDGEPAALTHLGIVPEKGEVALQSGGRALLGSPMRPATLLRCEGIVELSGGTLMGWISRPAAPPFPPAVFLLDAANQRRKIPIGDTLPAHADAPLTIRYAFHCPAAMLSELAPPFRVLGPDGNDIFGSPVYPEAEDSARAMTASHVVQPPQAIPRRAELRIVVPVYRGFAATKGCLIAALQALPKDAVLIVVDDASPEPELQLWLDEFCRDPRIVLIRHEKNLGFPAAANAGLAAAGGCDVLLLNSDTLLPAQSLRTLLTALYARPDIGSATPFSNEATICSYPKREGGNPAPDLSSTVELDAMAADVNGEEIVEIPTGIGFCLLMRHDCIAKTGWFRAEVFSQGYGEEVDWSLRAGHCGYRHVAAAGAYVAHLSKLSFGIAGHALNERNAGILLRLHPGFDELVKAHVDADPLAAARRRLDWARFRRERRENAVLLISHGHGGGVQRRVEFEMQEIRSSGQRPILIFPVLPGAAGDPVPYPAELTDKAQSDYPNLRFALPDEKPELLEVLRGERISHVILHHGLGHHSGLRGIANQLHVPQDIVVHDYASFCPRVHLIDANGRYCGEPQLQDCNACVAKAGDETHEGLGPSELVERSAHEFAAARRIIAPSADCSRRITRHFPKIVPTVTPWEDDRLPLRLRAPGSARRRIAVLGGIGLAKGYDVLLECGLDAARRDLALDFVIAGSSFDDERLMETGRIFVTGAYGADELAELLAGLQADLAFIPSIWPETWCFTLGEAWAAGLYTLAFDLGAQADRITANKRGGLLPLGLPAPRINDVLQAWTPPLNL